MKFKHVTTYQSRVLTGLAIAGAFPTHILTEQPLLVALAKTPATIRMTIIQPPAAMFLQALATHHPSVLILIHVLPVMAWKLRVVHAMVVMSVAALVLVVEMGRVITVKPIALARRTAPEPALLLVVHLAHLTQVIAITNAMNIQLIALVIAALKDL
jgi:hypothetical protein